MNDRLKELYKTQILTQAKKPANFHEMPAATHVLEAYNPMCGDQYKLFLKLEVDRVVDASFHGYGCAISKASTAVLVKRIIGARLEEIQPLITLFFNLIDPNSEVPIAQITDDQELLAFSGTRQYPEREQCASLSWAEFAKFLDLPA